MRCLLDTCVLSEARRSDPAVVAMLRGVSGDEVFVSVISMGEITKGIELLADGRKKQELRVWLDSLEQHYSGQILPIDEETARIWGEITASAQSRGKILPAADGLIAATALRHGLVVMTRNTEDFAASGVRLLDPWSM